MVKDLIIVGAGPAGITAAVYAARKQMDFIVVSRDIGGQAAWSGEIEINCATETSVPGLFAAGDVTDVPAKQIIIAAGDGAKATMAAFTFLSRTK